MSLSNTSATEAMTGSTGNVAGDAAIRIHGRRKVYGERVAVRDLSFAVQPGEIFALLGPNGAGKTTTIEILEGYRTVDGGSAYTAVPPLTLVPPELLELLLVLLLLQPAATTASATAPAPTPMVIRLRSRSLLGLRLLCSCGAGPMAAAPSYIGSCQAHHRTGVLRPDKASP